MRAPLRNFLFDTETRFDNFDVTIDFVLAFRGFYIGQSRSWGWSDCPFIFSP